MNSITLLLSIGVSTIIAISVFGLINLNNDNSITNDQINLRNAIQEGNPFTGNIKLLNDHLEKPLFSNWKVKGQVQNSGSSKIIYCLINVNFLGKSGNLLYSNSIKLNNIKPGEIKNFEVDYKGDTAPDSYKIELSV